MARSNGSTDEPRQPGGRSRRREPAPDRSPDDDVVVQLIRSAGRRPQAPEMVQARVRRSIHAVWRVKVETHAAVRRRRRYRMLAAAAVVVLGVSFIFWRQTDGPGAPQPVTVATVEAVAGTVHVGRHDADLAVGSDVAAGTELATGDRGRAALRLVGGHSLRLDVSTRVRLESARLLVLEAGAVYLDSAGATPGTGVAVSTAYGVARDVGTQFEVRLLQGGLRVQVRQGRVALESDKETHMVPEGTALTVRVDGTVERDRTAAWGPTWSWVLATAPPFEPRDRTLAELLGWVARETGWRIAYDDPRLEGEMAGITVRGSVASLKPDQAAAVMLPSAGFGYRFENGTLVVERTVND